MQYVGAGKGIFLRPGANVQIDQRVGKYQARKPFEIRGVAHFSRGVGKFKLTVNPVL